MRNLMVRGVAAGAVAALLSLLSLDVAAAAERGAAPETRLVGVVNVNTATSEQLELLPGIGPARAAAILEHRKEHKGFKRVDDLTQVSGIGDRALERIRSHVALKGKTTARLLAE